MAYSRHSPISDGGTIASQAAITYSLVLAAVAYQLLCTVAKFVEMWPVRGYVRGSEDAAHSRGRAEPLAVQKP